MNTLNKAQLKKILLIEDDQVMRENTAEILELANYHVQTATNGKEGIKLIKADLPDLIICDIMMPELDGHGVLHILSKNAKTAHIPFIFLTAKAEKSDQRKGMELGADDYLTKPFEDTDLLKAIETRLNKHSSFKEDLKQDLNELHQFIDQARGVEELKELSINRSCNYYKKKHIIYSEGDIPQYLYFLNKGKIKIYKTHDDGKEYISEILSDGQFFGIPPLLENKLHCDSASVLDDSEIYKIPKEDFMALIYRNRDVAIQFIKMLANNVEKKEKQLLSFAYDTVRKRTAMALLQLQGQSRNNMTRNQLHSNSSPTELAPIKITREDLAGLAGTATETVIRCLSSFKSENLIKVKGREIIILNSKGLAQVQC